MSLVSIIVPVYNAAKYLPQCLNSLLAQTYANFEVICINDGSTDNSLQILENYRQTDARIKVFSKENGGLSLARNYGLDLAKGEYVCFLDSDDFVCTSFLEIMQKEIQNVDVVACSYQNVDETAAFFSDKVEFSYIAKNWNATEYFSQSKDMGLTAWGKLYRREVLNGYKFDENCFFSEDVLFHAAVFAQNLKLKVIDAPLVYYRYAPNSLLHAKASVRKVMSLLNVAEKISLEYKNSSLWSDIYMNRVVKSVSNALKYAARCADKNGLNTQFIPKLKQMRQKQNLSFSGLSFSKKIALFKALYL